MPNGSLKISAALTTSSQVIEKILNDEIAEHMEQVVFRISSTITQLSSVLIDGALRSEPEYISLLSGELRAHFGLEEPGFVVNRIILAIVDNIQVRYVPPFEMVVEILSDDVFSILDNAGASYTSNGSVIPWLEWLLTQGDSVIISSYHIDFSKPRESSRTGSAIMLPRGSWRVPSEFSGTIEDNWITRAINKVSGNILRVIQDEFQKEF